MNLSYRFAASLLAGSIMLGGTGSALAAGKGKASTKLAYAYGQVSTVSSTGFTLTPAARKPKAGATSTTPAAPIAVATTATTKERALKGTTGALTDQDYALVIGASSASGIAATRVLYSTKPFKAGKLIKALRSHRVAGTVTGSTAASLTIQTKAGTTPTFSITDKTRFRVGGQVATTAPTFTTGEKVVVHYRQDKTGNSLVALGIAVRQATTA